MWVGESAVVARNACLSYRSGQDVSVVLNHLDMNVPRGAIYGLLGASGCGKTTLLSCIAGRLRLDSGVLRVLGGVPGAKGSGVPGPRIGYMPQEIALVNEMNVGNVIYYYGRLFGMSSSQIAERHAFLSRLLELPDRKMLVKNLSGGEQRRVSFAASLVHNPELLILDEPTVGLDPVLRHSIWNYLVQISRDLSMTIIITTHYIGEATQAHKIGLMRGGTLLADMAPAVLLANHRCTILEEVFMKLSQIQEDAIVGPNQTQDDAIAILNQMEDDAITDSPITDDQEDEIVSFDGQCLHYHPDGEILSGSLDRMTSRRHKYTTSFTTRMQALIYKDSLAILRSPWGLVLMFLFPVIHVSLFFPSIGNDPHDLAIGIVNDEITNCHNIIGEIRKHSGTLGGKENNVYGTCHFHGLSCLFIDKWDESVAKKVYFSDTGSALVAAKKLVTTATIHFPSNFSKLLEERVTDVSTVSSSSLESSQVRVWLDMSSPIISYRLQSLIHETYKSLSEELAVACNLDGRTFHNPMQFLEPVYGNRGNGNFREFMLPGFILMTVFGLSILETATVLITERTNGVWIRNIVSGVSAAESVLSHVLCQMTGIIVQLSEILFLVFQVFHVQCLGNVIDVLVIVFLQSMTGAAFGLLIGSVSKNTTDGIYMAFGLYQINFYLMGSLWPLEGAPKLLQHITYFSPCALASNSLRNIMTRGWGLTHHQVYPGYIMSICWIIGQLGISGWILGKKTSG